MDTLTVVLALVIGVAVGAVGMWWWLRQASGAADGAAAERLRADVAQARSDADRARAEAAQARAETSETATTVAQAQVRVQEAKAETALARQEIAEARADAHAEAALASQARAQVAGLEARVVAAVAQRDAAMARATEIAADRDVVVKEFKLLSGQALDEQGKRADVTAEQRLKATEQLMAPIKESLAAFNARLGEVEKARIEMSTELAGQVRAVQHTGEQLRRETHALSTALRKPQVRGAWGELQLKRVAELAGMLEHCDFVQQETTSTSEDRVIRPDLKVTLSEGKFIYVDSKVPLSAFLDAQETEDAHERERCLGLFARNVKSHVDALSSKHYWKADPGTPEFVVMFVPNEALGFEALRLIPDLHEYASTRDIIVATPTTLIALLRAVAYGWKQAQLAASAAQVAQLGRELYERLGSMGHNVDKLGRALGSAVKAYNNTVGSLEARVLVSARRFRDLNVTQADLAAPVTVEEPLRSIAATELTEDAAAIPSAVGRTRRGDPASTRDRPALPEADVLRRPDPALLDLIDEAGPEPQSGRGTMAG